MEIKGCPGICGIHKLYCRVKFKSSNIFIPASTVIIFFSLSKNKILLKFLILIESDFSLKLAAT